MTHEKCNHTRAIAREIAEAGAHRDEMRLRPILKVPGRGGGAAPGRTHLHRLQCRKCILRADDLRVTQRHLCGRRGQRQETGDCGGGGGESTRRAVFALRRLPAGDCGVRSRCGGLVSGRHGHRQPDHARVAGGRIRVVSAGRKCGWPLVDDAGSVALHSLCGRLI